MTFSTHDFDGDKLTKVLCTEHARAEFRRTAMGLRPDVRGPRRSILAVVASLLLGLTPTARWRRKKSGENEYH
jgi:hypothetical protein